MSASRILRNGLISAAALAMSAGLFTVPAAAQSAKPSLAERVQAIEDRQEIHDLIVEYGHLLDTKQYVAYGKLFAKDGTWNGSLGLHKGPDDITAMLANPKSGRAPAPFDQKNVQSFHLVTNMAIHLVDANHATGRTKWTFFTRSKDEKAAPVPTLSGHYDDTFVRENGVWKFQSRDAVHDIPS